MPTGISIVYRTSYYAINTWKQVGSFNAHLRKCTATYTAFAHEVTQCRLQNRRITNVATIFNLLSKRNHSIYYIIFPM